MPEDESSGMPSSGEDANSALPQVSVKRFAELFEAGDLNEIAEIILQEETEGRRTS